MIAIIDYGVGNLFSLKSSFAAIGNMGAGPDKNFNSVFSCENDMPAPEAVVTSDPSVIETADRIILPGVGAFEDAARKLKETGLGETVIKEAAKGKPLMGICLGMQLLFEKSYEYGIHDGLGLLKGNVRPIGDVIDSGLKIPHIGWNPLIFRKESPLFKYIKEGDCVYFVHSYYAADCEDCVIADAEYSVPLTAAVASGNVYGCQFHPEKSGDVGLRILKAFCEI